ncbi:energy-coupling factor transport system permease protein [Homoserinimonas aerilata]|uniref:Energy-coupling factor transport system permease protein n=1 Tax=Homoserinimonas aerilata TaxID=1162970 RepID=A0A542YJE1_9MICO|nr:energy-coupling factor transporter transmembrane component T [Homoserinimonas aerilata]TQL48190.1 energy-coupling factor transport system permease protein [Homoserinimonas aerilata]
MSALVQARGTAAIHTVNPVAKLATALLIAFTLVLSIDWVSASVALALELPLLAFAGVRARTLLLRTSPIWIAAPFAGLTILLYGKASGASHLEWMFVHVTDGSIELAVATVLRLLAIALPGVVLFITVDPTDLADGLAQIVKLPARFVLGALAGLRLVGLFLDDWKSLELARRARGLADSGRIRRLFGQAFALLVLSIRRGSKLATAMEARGFGGPTERSWARESHFGRNEWALLLIGVVIAATAVTTSVETGEWNFIAAP